MSKRDATLRSKPRRAEPAAAAAALPTPGLPLATADLAHSGVLHDSWRDYFRSLPPGAQILDIAPGIGALALLAREVERGFQVHGLDQAATLSAEPLRMGGILFHARRYDQRTPFEDGRFDAITVQWARPDDGTAAAGLAELRRILKPGGRMRLMYHALGGLPHEEYQARIRAVGTLLEEYRLLERARCMFEVAFTQETALRRDAARAAMLAMDSQRGYAVAAEQAAYWSRSTPNPKAVLQVLELIRRCWEQRHSLPLAEIQAQLDRVDAELRATQARMAAVCALAVDETRIHRIGRLFRAADFHEVKVRRFCDPEQGALLAWDLQAA